MLMKIGKITTLLCLLAAGTLTSAAQLSWVYEGKTLAEGETITIADNMDNLSAGKYIHIARKIYPYCQLFGKCNQCYCY